MIFAKNILRMAMVAFAAIAVTACDKSSDVNNNLELSVYIDNLTATSVKIEVSHNGKTADSWYGLLTTEVKTPESTLISNAVAQLKKGDIGSKLIFSKSYSQLLSPLSPNTSYKYIAFGLTEGGVVYGKSASVQFMTPASTAGGNEEGGKDEVYSSPIVNPAWSVSYTGAGTIDDVEYDQIVSVNSTDNNPYTTAVVYASEWDSSKLFDLGEGLVESMSSYLDSYNSAYGTSYTFNDILSRGNSATSFDELDPGYYIAVAVGITSKGEVSGLYAVSSMFHIEEQEPTSSYSAWLGDWVVTGDNNIVNNVVISRKVANKSIYLTGWMGHSFAIVGEYSTDRNDIIFYSQVVYPNYTFSDGTVANIVLVGSDEDGNTYPYSTNGTYGIAIAGVIESASEGSQRMLVRYGVNDITYPKFNAMLLLAEINGKLYTIGNGEMSIPSFNAAALIDAPNEVSTSAVSPMRFSLGKSKFGESKFREIAKPLSIGKEVTRLANF